MRRLLAIVRREVRLTMAASCTLTRSLAIGAIFIPLLIMIGAV